MKNKVIIAVFSGAMILSMHGVFADKGNKPKTKTLTSRTTLLENQIRSLQSRIDAMEKRDKDHFVNRLDSLVEMYAHGPAVVTSPSLGVRRSAEDASDLMVNLSSVNEDLVLLKLRQKMDNYALEQGLPLLERPIIAISGGVEGVADYRHRENYTNSKKSDINFSRAELDIVGEASPWATAVINVVYEDSEHGNYGRRIDNSRFKLDRGFLTIGQLNKCPLYFTLGQIFAPFGSYSSYMLTDPVTKVLGRVKDRLILLGYSVGGIWGSLDAQMYGFSGNIKSGHELLGKSGLNLNYGYSVNKFKLNFGGGVIGNIAESSGIFGTTFVRGSEKKLEKRVYGLNARAKMGYDAISLSAEYVGAGKSFAKSDINFNNKGAKPQAVNLEGAIEFTTFNHPSTFALGYGRTWQALSIELPKHSFFATYGISLLKNAILGFEYRHDVRYDVGTTAITKSNTISVAQGNHRHQNIFTLQLGVYF